jgi:hypothetical protein
MNANRREYWERHRFPIIRAIAIRIALQLRVYSRSLEYDSEGNPVKMKSAMKVSFPLVLKLGVFQVNN